MLVLIGILIIIAGFVLRFNPLLVIMASALATGLAAGLDIAAIIAAFGKAFNDTRYVSIIWIVLPVIGLLEAYGLQQHARSLIGRIRSGAVGGLLIGYLLIRQIFAALGLTSVAGHPQTVRPLVAPMAEAAAEAQNPALTIAQREEVKAYSAATDNIGLFFGEDIDEAERDHAPRSAGARIRLSRRQRRKLWMTNAAIAVGIAHSEKWSGSI